MRCSLVNHLVDRLSPIESGKSKTFRSALHQYLEFLNTLTRAIWVMISSSLNSSQRPKTC